jgi:hypothetical protein
MFTICYVCVLDIPMHESYLKNKIKYISSVIFRRFRKIATVSCVMSVCPTARKEQLGFHWTDFHEM